MGTLDNFESDPFALAEEPFSHLTRETRAVLDGSIESKIQYIDRDTFIGWPLANQAIDAVLWRLRMVNGPRRRCLAVFGETGMGKSWIWREVCRRIGIDEKMYLTRGGQRPVLYLSLAACTSFLEFLGRLLNALGSPLTKKRIDPVWAKIEIVRLFKASAFLLVFLDECQDLGKIRNDNEREDVALLLKHLTNECGRPLVMMGSHEASVIINRESHLRSRFDSITLEKWVEEESARAFIFGLLSLIPLPNESPITDDVSISSFLKRVDGVTERVAQSIRYAGRAAVLAKMRCIDLQFLFDHAI